MQTFFHPDYTVDSGITPNHVLNLIEGLVGYTTDRESHPTPKDIDMINPKDALSQGQEVKVVKRQVYVHIVE